MKALRELPRSCIPVSLVGSATARILEALANGIPVILPDTSAARDLVEDGVTGLWFRMGDTEDLARKITLFKDPMLGTQTWPSFLRQVLVVTPNAGSPP